MSLGLEQTSLKLSCSFISDANLKTTIIINDPLDGIGAEKVSESMAAIVGKDVLTDSKGNLVTAGITAKLIQVSEQVLF